jgi:segregation and condensation protein A
VKEPPTGELARPRFTVAQKIAAIASRLKWSTEGLQFVELFEGDVSRIEVIVSFLALLELVRLKRARVLQDGLLGEIKVYPIEAATEL